MALNRADFGARRAAWQDRLAPDPALYDCARRLSSGAAGSLDCVGQIRTVL
ncbi:hypothetical protein ABH935_006141 [Catenulispora sp. GAS73]